MKHSVVSLAVVALVVASVTIAMNARAADDPAELGAKLVREGNDNGAIACSTCHGEDGAGNGPAKYPRLAGINGAYLAKQLRDYKKKEREHPVMKPIVAGLSDDEIEAVSAYFADLDTKSTAEAPEDKDLLERGERIALQGVWAKDVPACNQCHGPQGQGIAPHFPALAGQHASYIEAQFDAWKSGARHNDPNGLMEGVAKRLSDEQVQAVAAYFASLPAASSDNQESQ